MGRLQDAIRAWAISDGVDEPQISASEDGTTCSYGFESGGDNETYRVFIDGNEKSEVLSVFVYAPNKAPEKRLAAISELVARLNYGLSAAHFDFDWRDGEIRCRSAIDVEDAEIVDTMIHNLCRACFTAMDNHYPSIMQVAFGGASPEQALEGPSAADESNAGEPAGELPLVEWSEFPGTSVLKDWVAELKDAHKSKSDEAWQLAGSAVLVTHTDSDECALLARRAAADLGFQFARVPAEAVLSGKNDIRTRFKSMSPVVVYLDDGEWLAAIDNEKEGDEAAAQKRHAQRQFAGHLHAFNVEAPVVIFACTKDRGKVAQSLLEFGAFDRQFSVPPLDKEPLARQWLNDFDEKIVGPSLKDGLSKLGALLKNNFSSRDERNLAALQLKRVAKRQQRPLEFNDVVELVIRGAVEKDASTQTEVSEHSKRKTAVHEAGHAATAVLMSGGRNVPDYASIIPGNDFAGIVMESVSYNEAGKSERSFADVRQKIRICLAGRAAEDLVLGPLETSAGAASDLDHATRLSLDAIGHWGFSPDMEREGGSGSNLAMVVGRWNDLDYERVYPLVRRLLEQEYAELKKLLAQHRPLLDAIADRLMWDPLVDQQELSELCRQHGVTVSG